MGEVIAIVSGKGGCGKTTFAVNIAAFIAASNYKVLLIDENNGLRTLDIALGIEAPGLYNFVDFITGKCSKSDCIIHYDKLKTLDLIMASQINNENIINAEKVKEKYNELKEEYDYIILDTPCGVSNGLHSCFNGIDRAMFVITPDSIAVRNADKIKSILIKSKVKNASLIINKIDEDLVKKKAQLSNDEIYDLLGLEIAQTFAVDINFMLSLARGESLLGTNTACEKRIKKLTSKRTGKKLNDLIDDNNLKKRRKIFNLFKK